MSKRIAIGFSNCLGNFVIMTAALKILRERHEGEIFMITDKDVLSKHPAVKALAECLFDGVVTKYDIHDFDKIYVGDWSCPQCIIDKGDFSKKPIRWTGRSSCTGMHEVQVYLDMIEASKTDFSGLLSHVADKPILTGRRPRIALANASPTLGSRSGNLVGWSNFPELSKRLQALNYEVILVGQGEELKGCVGINFVDKLNIFETSKVISQCDLMISTDTGLMHVADSLAVPLIVLVGPTPMTKAHPLVSSFRIVRKFVSCAPCYHQNLWDLCSDPVCMTNIKVEDVLKQVFIFKLPKETFETVPLIPCINAPINIPQNCSRRLKIVMPYYKGGTRIDEAVKSWPKDVILLAITDRNIEPPEGYKFFYTSDNAKKRGLSNKTKPILKDVLQRLIQKYPDEVFYGFINSDIILPPDIDVQTLLPSSIYKAAIHHRLDVQESTSNKKGAMYQAGKDCFIWTTDVAKKIAEDYPALVIGSCNWDDGLVHWLWREYGYDTVELRYGEVWHVKHKPGWTGDDTDAHFNGAALDAIGITTALRHSYDWNLEYTNWKMKLKKIGIVQPGRIGDILIVLPIAKWYAKKGYEVFWPVHKKYVSLFKNIDYVTVIDTKVNLERSYQRSLELLRPRVEKIIDLGIGFGRNESDWLQSQLTFDRWKYKEAGVPFSERCNLQIHRNHAKEQELKTFLKLPSSYTVTHSKGESAGSYNFNKTDAVEVRPIDGFTLFDWIGVVEDAKDIFCINSCVMNLLEGLCIGEKHRSVKLWQNKWDADRGSLLIPKLRPDWSLIDDPQKLPVSFFTIVYNGMPFIKHHLKKFQQLPFTWHWYIIEGLSEVAGDPGARGHKRRGGQIPKACQDFLSTDGTREYLDEIADLKNVTVIRSKDVWKSKLKMISSFLPSLTSECLLWQIDVDEFYAFSTMMGLYRLFFSNVSKKVAAPPPTAFVCKTKIIVSKNTWGSYQYARLWRFVPGCTWASHEPPILLDTAHQDLAQTGSFTEEELKAFSYHHYNYIYESQVKFKEDYYGYKDLFDAWTHLKASVGKQKMQNFYDVAWVDDAVIDDWHGRYLIPLEEK